MGLPEICTRGIEGKMVHTTEYTMSEIIASIYDCMEQTGKKRGILFLDEINCVSETLAPVKMCIRDSLTVVRMPVQENPHFRDFLL